MSLPYIVQNFKMIGHHKKITENEFLLNLTFMLSFWEIGLIITGTIRYTVGCVPSQ